MGAAGWIAIYTAAVLVVSMSGGLLPLAQKITHRRLQFYLSASAGVMLGAAFFHIIPDAVEASKENFGWWMSLGVVGLFCIERFVAPHTHEGEAGHLAEHHHQPGEFVPVNAKGLDHGHVHVHGPGCSHDVAPLSPLAPPGVALPDVGCTEPDHYTAAPAFSGWMAVLGLTLHTFMNGVGLGGAVIAGLDPEAVHKSGWLGQFSLPGIALFLAIALHKPADALAVSTMLSKRRVSRTKIMLVQLGFALMVPAGAFLILWLGENFEAQLRGQLVGAALAFSAGTFLFIALSDLLPEVQFHHHDRGKLFVALLAGVALMGFIALLEGHAEAHG